ncbi:MAG: hypothetical protein Q4G07_05540 [Oscillospiraceae bacterium]|nr:hypothetical protein [Oscillospiraceae bacterium]
MKTIGKIFLVLFAAAAAALGIYLLEKKSAPRRYIDIYSNYKEDEE